jgi:hypothetical protein
MSIKSFCMHCRKYIRQTVGTCLVCGGTLLAMNQEHHSDHEPENTEQIELVTEPGPVPAAVPMGWEAIYPDSLPRRPITRVDDTPLFPMITSG